MKYPAKSKMVKVNEPLRGSTLEQMWLEGVNGKLHPAEEKLLEACQRGRSCNVGKTQPDGEIVRPSEISTENVVREKFLRYLILGGCEEVEIHARGIRLLGAWISCDSGTYDDNELDLEATDIPCEFFLGACVVDGIINLVGSKSSAINLGGTSVKGIVADRLDCSGSFYLNDGFLSEGVVRLVGVNLEGQLDCHDGKFNDEFICQEATIKAGVYLLSTNTEAGKEFIATGKVSFANATIGGNIHCDKGQFLCKDQAFFANRADIKGDVSFDDAKILGTVALTGTEIGGSLAFNRTRLNGKPSLQLRGSKIAGTLYWRDLKAVDGDVDLGGASCNTISFGPKSWMRKFEQSKNEAEENLAEEVTKPGKRPSTKLDNFTYNGFNNPPDKADGKFWIDWLKVQPDDHLGKKFRPKPWTQLANVLESMGYEGEAKKVLVEREWMLTRFMARHDPENSKSSFFSFNWARVMWRRIWGVTIDYGYQPLKALFYLTAVIMIGFGVFYWASLQGIMAPTHPLVFNQARIGGSIDKKCAQNWVWLDEKCSRQMPSEYSEFASFFYSADVALPIINLRQQEDWSPRVVDHKGNRIWTGYFVRMWEWFATVIGWVLSLMFVSAVGGFIRR